MMMSVLNLYVMELLMATLLYTGILRENPRLSVSGRA